MQDAIQFIKDDVQFDQRRAPHAIDECQYLLAGLETEILNNGISQHLSYISSWSELDAVAARLAMNTNADLHFVFAQFESGLAGCRHSTGGQGHTHAAPLIIDLAGQCGHLL